MGTERSITRRGVLSGGAGLCLVPALAQAAPGGGAPGTPVENLMREHGVLRRILTVYSEVPALLRGKARIDAGALNDAAALFQLFGEVYHQKRLEEDRVFQDVAYYGGPAAQLVPVLLRQHERGREITRFILNSTKGGGIAGAEPLARALESMARMYRAHATWEDTVVFPAWEAKQSDAQRNDALLEFDEVERRMFGPDGFNVAVARILRIEQRLGLAGLDRYTAPARAG